MENILLIAIIVILIGILIAVKKGFNEVITGLESLDERLSKK